MVSGSWKTRYDNLAQNTVRNRVHTSPDERDPCSLPASGISYLRELDRGMAGVRIAYSPDLGYAEVKPEVARIGERSTMRFQEAGASIERVDLNWQDPYNCWNIFFYGGIAAVHCHRPADQLDLLDPGLRPIIEKGVMLSAVDFVKATLERNAFWQQV